MLHTTCMFSFSSHFRVTLQTNLLLQRACFQDEVSHLDTLELKSGHLNNGSSSHQVRSSCAPSYLVFAAEQSTRVRDEVAKRPEALVFGVFEDGQEAPVSLPLCYEPPPPLFNTHKLFSFSRMMSSTTWSLW